MSTVQEKFAEFEESCKNAIKQIEVFLEPGKYEPHMDKLVKWMLTSDTNPYEYLPAALAGSLYSAQGFASLCSRLHHAIYDDGEVTFITVDGNPRIAFEYHYNDGFYERAREGFSSSAEVVILDIQPNEFCEILDNWSRKYFERCFAYDFVTLGEAQAVTSYKSNRWYKPTLKEDLSELIAKYAKQRDILNSLKY